MMTVREFIKRLAEQNLSASERAVAVIWFTVIHDDDASLSCTQVCREIEEAGFGKQNATRISRALSKDRRIVKAPDGEFKISQKALSKLTETYGAFLGQMPSKPSDSVVEIALFENARGYTRKVVSQLNASYDHGLFDCTAVMCRRLLETLIIEAYEQNGCSDGIKDKDGHYFMFAVF